MASAIILFACSYKSYDCVRIAYAIFHTQALIYKLTHKYKYTHTRPEHFYSQILKDTARATASVRSK